MAVNDVIILDQIIKQKQHEIAPNLSDNEYFELFVAEQVLKDYGLSYEEVNSGIVGNGGNGGIDSIYVFINGELLHEDTDLSVMKKGITIDLIVIQAKTSKSFSEGVLDKFIDVSENLLDLSTPLFRYKSVYNIELLDIVKRFREAYEYLASSFPKLRVYYYYATKGNRVNHTLLKKAEKLKSKVKQLFSSSECFCAFLEASELLEMARRLPQTTYSLNLTEIPISSSNEIGYICLVSVSDYFRFIIDNEGNLRKSIFEANVRDYQGKSPVNEEIQQSLRNPHNEDFWWLNNGVTILASQVILSGKTLRIENPEIVNGLQTSTEIYKYCKETNSTHDNRNILIRVVVPKESESRDRIIKATNSQTQMSPASLRATEKIHRDIEEYLRPFGIYYDRRKNYYKNEGKPLSKIISIPYLAQAIMAIVLQRPDDARARPSSLLNREEDYALIFNLGYPIKIYYFCLSIMQHIEQSLKSEDIGLNLDRKTRGDIKFHVATYISILVTRKINATAMELAEIQVRDIDESNYQISIQNVLSLYKKLTEVSPVASDKVAKSPEFKSAIIEDAKNYIMKKV